MCPIKLEAFKDLPEVMTSAQRGGKKCDWNKIRELMDGNGGYTKKEVHELTLQAALVELEDDEETGDLKPPVGEFRTGRWLKKQVEKGKMEARTLADGTYVYMTVGIVIKPDEE